MKEDATQDRRHSYIPKRGRRIGLHYIEQLINRRFNRLEGLIATSTADQEALRGALTDLGETDTTIDAIEPGEAK